MGVNIGGCIFLILCAITVSIISIATPYWITEDTLVDKVPVHVYTGLWTSCADAEGITECETFSNVKDWVNAVRALMMIGIILLGFSCLLLVVFARNTSDHRNANECILLLTISGVLLAAAVIVFGQNIEKEEVSFGSSFYLPIPVVILSLGTAIVVHKAKRPAEYTTISS